MMLSGRKPILSLILCSRNDAYMGNSTWRLETVLNYTCDRVAALGRETDVEVIVADWGSEVPLSRVVSLKPAAAALVSFAWIPPALARERQGASPFPEVLALNAAARRARGSFIGRIDQDTLVGERFLRTFFDWTEGGWQGDAPISATLLFANRRSIPYRFAVRCPLLADVERFVGWLHRVLKIETSLPGKEFYGSDVGIWLLHRDLWEDCRGYDERLIYMNDMEIDMAHRSMAKYPMVDLGKLVSYDFYHLDHYHPRGSRSSSTHRRVNKLQLKGARTDPDALRTNGPDWGLADCDVPLAAARAAAASRPQSPREPAGTMLRPAALVVYVGVRLALDFVAYRIVGRWRNRARLAWRAIREQPIDRWPGVLMTLWQQRQTARARRAG